MRNLFISLSILSISISPILCAEELEEIVIQDILNINPNTSQPQKYNRTKATSTDGGDFLKQINGVSTSRFGGRGLEPIIRGQSQTRLNVLLDGAFVQGGCPNRMDPPTSWTALDTYEKVKVVKGVQSLTYGSGGSGGTVLFERDTRDLAQDKGLHGRFSIMVGNNGIKHDLLADVVAASDKAYLRGIGQIKQADNYKDGSGHEVKSSFDHKQGGFIAGYMPTDDRLFEFSAEHNDFADALYPGANMDSPTEKGDIYRFKYLDKPANKKIDEVKVETYLSDIDHVMDNFSLRNHNPTMKRKVDTTSKTSGGKIALKSTKNKTQWTYGIDLQQNKRNAALKNVNNGMIISHMWPDTKIQQTGVFAEALATLSPKQKLKYGLRIDQVNVSANKANQTTATKTANQAYNTYYGTTAQNKNETNVGALLRFEQNVGKGKSIFAGVSRTVRTADATERSVNKWNANAAQRWIGNPNIKPEKHHQIDIGLSQQNKKHTITGTVFYDYVTDYILRDTARNQAGIKQNDQASIYRNVNAELAGTEIEGKVKLTDKLDFTASAAYVISRNKTDNGRALAQTPPLNGKLQLDYDVKKWGAGGRLRFANNQTRVDTLSQQDVGKTSGYGILDVYGNYKLHKNVNLRYGVDNVIDKTYATHSSRANLLDNQAVKVNEPGRTAWLKLAIDF